MVQIMRMKTSLQVNPMSLILMMNLNLVNPMNLIGMKRKLDAEDAEGDAEDLSLRLSLSLDPMFSLRLNLSLHLKETHLHWR